MGKIEIDSGRSSATTHRSAQASTTLNRRYVRRPSNLAIDEIAKVASLRTHTSDESSLVPSRLVNLRIHADELAKAQAEARESKPETARVEPSIPMTPSVVEFGRGAENEYTAPARPELSMASEYTASAEPEAMVESTPKMVDEIDTATLAASIAADYAATSLGLSIQEFGNGHDSYAMSQPNGETLAENQADAEAGIESARANIEPTESEPMVVNPQNDSVEAIALAASNAIASIREATEPNQVSAQVESLKAFAKNIKSGPDLPEMRELGDTIEKFVNIAMKSTKIKTETEQKITKTKVTLPAKVTRAADKVTKTSAKVISRHPASMQARMPKSRMRIPNATLGAMQRRPSTQELKSRALESALESVATMEERNSARSNKSKILPRRKAGAKRFAIAFACAAICIVAVIGFVGSNIPDISVRVAAMQTGIQASYPSYIPRDYSLSDINSEDGKITMTFNGPDRASFKLIEEKSSWDSSALLRNYVEPSWGEEYATTHEQGVTIYISNANSNAAWVNGGVLYKITTSGTALTKKQVRSIVTSM